MNGLNFVRTRCNISVSELADILDVSRQAINLWEKGKKPVPEERKSQLTEYFGVEKEYFGEITEKQKQILLEKAMFRCIEGDKEYYTYKACPPDADGRTMIYFPGDKETSVDEDYLQMQRHMKNTLEKASEIIRYYDWGKGTEAKSINIRRGCRIYDGINQIMDEIPKQETLNRMLYFHEIDSIIQAILLSQDLITKEDAQTEEEHMMLCYDNREWISSLARIFREHWEGQKAELNQETKGGTKKSSDNSDETPEDLTERIAYAESQNREIRNGNSGIKKDETIGIFC